MTKATHRRPGFVHSPAYETNIGNHVFITSKFRRYREACVAAGLVRDEEIEAPPPATEEELLTVLEPEYLRDLLGYRHTPRTNRSELPIDRPIVEGSIRCAGGSILAAQRALERGAAIHFGGGYHHGFAGHAEGFCYINDVAVAAAVALRRGWCDRVAVIDTDVHQGNGTARIFVGEPRVFTFSIHQENNYPVKERSSLDIGLPDRCGDAAYLEALARGVHTVFADFRPELLLYVAGVDPFEEDRLGNLGITRAGMEERERIVLEASARAGVPFVTLTGGGYARDPDDTVRLHCTTAAVALEVHARYRG